MATAKGICYALKIPLITLNTLEVMALSAINNTTEAGLYFYCPMIDARRMEVFTALFDDHLKEIIPPSALILQPDSFSDYMQLKQIIFYGNGAKKFLSLSNYSNLIYEETLNSAPAFAFLAFQKFKQSAFADLVNAEPAYIKQFYTIRELAKR
jgi:tRNA threonylcarbamoyladenosine biosynthesis protein TsaB